MKRLFLPIVVLLAAAWFLSESAGIKGLDDLLELARGGKMAGEAGSRSGGGNGASSSTRANPNAVRIASFNMGVFGESKLAKPHVVEILAGIVRRFDVVAVQEIRSQSQQVIPQFLATVNADGSSYDYVIGPRLGRTSSKEQYAYLFNTQTIEIDRGAIYTVDDPYDLMHREPLVAAFRARGASPERAFTFTLINVHTDPDEAAAELDVLDDVFRAVRGDGRGEDDVILLGDLNADERHLGQLGQLPYAALAIRGVATNTRGDQQYDNIVFDERATIEFTGSSGVIDLVREFNLTVDQSLEISDHLPVWAEFTLQEGGDFVGGVARRDLAPVER